MKTLEMLKEELNNLEWLPEFSVFELSPLSRSLFAGQKRPLSRQLLIRPSRVHVDLDQTGHSPLLCQAYFIAAKASMTGRLLILIMPPPG
jgi:hypothetical protein